MSHSEGDQGGASAASELQHGRFQSLTEKLDPRSLMGEDIVCGHYERDELIWAGDRRARLVLGHEPLLGVPGPPRASSSSLLVYNGS